MLRRVCASADLPEPLLLAYTKYGRRRKLRPKLRYLAQFDSLALTFIKRICAYAISTKISCTGPILTETCTPTSNLGYLAPPRTIFHGCQIVYWDPLDAKRRCPQKNFGLGYEKLHGFYVNP